MAATMTTRERFQRMFEHRDADRIPIWDGPWGSTIERWQREGMPADADWRDYFGTDHISGIGIDASLRFEARTIEETDEYRIFTTADGATMKDFKHAATVPEHLSYTITSADAWQQAKPRLTPTRDRVDWDQLARDYPIWRERGDWINAYFWFGFDITHSRIVGTERLLMAMVYEPEWIVDMWQTQLDLNIALFDQIWDAGYTFDGIRWPDDMGYKHNTFFSLGMYRELLKPFHQKAVEWAHAKGIKAQLHSCGDVRTFVPDLVEIGIDALNPLEVKAGMDPVKLKETYGDHLVLHGGVNAVLWDQPEAIRAEIQSVVPRLKEQGGYIFASDHSIPSAVSLEDMRGIIELVKELGRY